MCDHQEFPSRVQSGTPAATPSHRLLFLLILGQADLNYNTPEDPAAFYGVTSQYESSENMTITCSTKVCSFGKQVVEKVEVSTHPKLPPHSR